MITIEEKKNAKFWPIQISTRLNLTTQTGLVVFISTSQFENRRNFYTFKYQKIVMSIHLQDDSGSLIEFQNTLPVDYAGPRLRGSQVFYFAKDAYKLIVQKVRTELYIRLHALSCRCLRN